jgi:hypothetical protein
MMFITSQESLHWGLNRPELAASVVNTRRAAGLVGMCMVLTLASICNDGYLAWMVMLLALQLVSSRIVVVMALGDSR